MRRHRAVLILAMLAALPSGVAAAQEVHRLDPMEAALLFVLRDAGLADLGENLVVDTLRLVRGPPHAPATARRIREMANRLGARAGSLDSLFACPTRIPTPEEFLDWGCRFRQPVTAVVQVGALEETDDGPRVRVGYTVSPRPGDLGVRVWWPSVHRVMLIPEPCGGWRAVGIDMVWQA